MAAHSTRCLLRLVLEEERQWRALPGRGATARRGRGAAPDNPDTVPGLATLTSVYRQLRKAREDALDQPGAADFYYGEMEMRRHSHTWRRAERKLRARPGLPRRPGLSPPAGTATHRGEWPCPQSPKGRRARAPCAPAQSGRPSAAEEAGPRSGSGPDGAAIRHLSRAWIRAKCHGPVTHKYRTWCGPACPPA
ncbi:hypothetical protein FS847_01620 [Streptomyces sp. ISID311]|nr:hypothetical protein FS847_01620 [Streptomyces sp. ISID311]